MTGALVITAGNKDSKNRFFPEKRIGSISALERIVAVLKDAGINRIAVVESEENEQVKKLVSFMNVVFLTIPAGADMFDGIKKGLEYFIDKCGRVLIVHADVPMFSKHTVKKLIEARGEIIIPVCKGHSGHPVAVSSECFEKVISYKGTGGLKGAINANKFTRNFIETEDPGVLNESKYNVSYDELIPDHDINQLRASFKIMIGREKVFYGPGAHHLLMLTDEFGSLLEACRHMGISYSKGRKIISVMVQQLGKDILQTQQGGKTGGYSQLTDEALRLMDTYRAFNEEAEEMLQEVFKKHFKDYR